MSARPDLDTSAIGKLCQRNVICIVPTESIVAAAERMRTAHVGSLVVIDSESTRKAIGMLTDRDIVVSVVARNADPNALTVGDVMSRHPLMVTENSSLDAALTFMQDAGVRRLIVTGASGEVVGMLAVDDILQKIGMQIGLVCGSLRNEIQTERLVRP
ncbi:MAG TPA: CBS domain-containing protein [Steroidobacteraceae bacterium]|jgi:CBS domain-containing protein|nr:CBS domain-containing protein [Steroidobacteraceae bacterium]